MKNIFRIIHRILTNIRLENAWIYPFVVKKKIERTNRIRFIDLEFFLINIYDVW